MSYRVNDESMDVGDSLGADQGKLLIVEALEDREFQSSCVSKGHIKL